MKTTVANQKQVPLWLVANQNQMPLWLVTNQNQTLLWLVTNQNQVPLWLVTNQNQVPLWLWNRLTTENINTEWISIRLKKGLLKQCTDWNFWIVPDASMKPSQQLLNMDDPYPLLDTRGQQGSDNRGQQGSDIKGQHGSGTRGQQRSDIKAQHGQCSVCLQLFTNASNLRRHIATHSGQKTYKCRLCDKSFSRSDSVKRHIVYKHKDMTLTWIQQTTFSIHLRIDWMLFSIHFWTDGILFSIRLWTDGMFSIN